MDQNRTINDFIEKLISEKGFINLTPEVKDQLKKDIMQRLDDFIAARVITALSDQDLSAFEQMLKDGKPQEELQQFTSTHIPDFTEFLTNTLLEFRGVYLGVIGGETSTENTSAPPTPPNPAPVND